MFHSRRSFGKVGRMGNTLPAAILILLGACAGAKPGGVAGDDAGGDDAGPSDARAEQNVFYISLDGADSNSGTEPDHPLRHVAFAIEKAAACTPSPCSIRIAEGVYEEPIALAAG